MRERLSRFVVVALLAAALGPLAAVAPAGAGSFPSACPNMTDSITRLYSAFFLRAPDQQGFDYWVGVYKSTPDGLREMANNFVISAEFLARYGSLSDAQFVDRVYENVLGRAGDPEGRAHWIGALDRGFDRGSVMISFSESQEFVTKTQTAAPAAGFLSWYQGDVRFDCGERWLWVTVNGHEVVDDRFFTFPPSPSGVRFGGGTVTIGSQVPPGTYRTESSTDGCYWERLSGFGGTFDQINANDIGDGRRLVTILASDVGFDSTRCGTWTSNLAPITATPSAPFGDGEYLVGVDIAPGTWQASTAESCYWERVSDFTDGYDSIIANDFGGSIVTISATDVGFSTQRCGTWSRIG